MDSPEINAFALPGGYVYVTRGLLALVNNEAELAGVIGHEIGHIIFHHGAKQMVRNIGAQIFAIGGAIASPKNAGGWLTVSTALFQQISMGYGRDAEIESDEVTVLVNSAEIGSQFDTQSAEIALNKAQAELNKLSGTGKSSEKIKAINEVSKAQARIQASKN